MGFYPSTLGLAEIAANVSRLEVILGCQRPCPFPWAFLCFWNPVLGLMDPPTKVCAQHANGGLLGLGIEQEPKSLCRLTVHTRAQPRRGSVAGVIMLLEAESTSCSQQACGSAAQ